MSSKRETILARIATVLAGTSGVGSRIYRSRVEPLARGELPALVIEPSNDAADLSQLGVITWTLNARVIILVAGVAPDQVADPIALDVHSKIMADTTLNGLVVDIVPAQTSFDLFEGDQPRGAITINFTILYRTARESIA